MAEIERHSMNTKLPDYLVFSYSGDKRRRRRQHRQAARWLINSGTLFNAKAPRGSIPYTVAQWHLTMARYLGR